MHPRGQAVQPYLLLLRRLLLSGLRMQVTTSVIHTRRSHCLALMLLLPAGMLCVLAALLQQLSVGGDDGFNVHVVEHAFLKSELILLRRRGDGRHFNEAPPRVVKTATKETNSNLCSRARGQSSAHSMETGV